MTDEHMRSIATKTGDKGETSLMFGDRVPKDHIRVDAYGSLDELNAVLGMARAQCEHQFLKELIVSIQNETFVVCGELATPVKYLPKLKKKVTADMVDRLSSQVDDIEKNHTFVMDWAVPGDHPSPAALDYARTVCRRAERTAIGLYRVEPESKNPEVIRYLNRLSDLLWLMARWQEKEHNVKLTSVRDFLDSDTNE